MRKRTAIRKIVNVMAEYFDVDNIEMLTDRAEERISVTMYSDEASYRVAYMNATDDGQLVIGVDYMKPSDSADTTSRVRLWEMKFVGSVHTCFKPLSMDIAFPDELVQNIIEVMKEVGC